MPILFQETGRSDAWIEFSGKARNQPGKSEKDNRNYEFVLYYLMVDFNKVKSIL